MSDERVEIELSHEVISGDCEEAEQEIKRLTADLARERARADAAERELGELQTAKTIVGILRRAFNRLESSPGEWHLQLTVVETSVIRRALAAATPAAPTPPPADEVAALRSALEKQQAVEDHTLECLYCLHDDDCTIKDRLTADANVARADALAAAAAPTTGGE